MGRKEWELQNKAIRDEKDQLNDYYMQLKHKLDKLHYTEHAAMKVYNFLSLQASWVNQ